MAKILCLFVLLWIACASAQIVRDEATTLLYRQADGIEVRLPKKPQRTVIVYASLAKIWYATGGTAVGVPTARSREALPEAARDVTSIGRMNMASPEHILLLKPDLVLLSMHLPRHRDLAVMLREMGVAALCCEYRNYADFAALLTLFSRLNDSLLPLEGHVLTAGIDALCARTRAFPPVRVAVIFAAVSGFSLETPLANTGYMVDMLGGKNIITATGETKIRFSYEKFLLSDPEVILVVPMGEVTVLKEKLGHELMSLPTWGRLSAVRTGRVHILPPEWFLYQAGPDYPQAFRYLAGLLYPGVDTAP